MSVVDENNAYVGIMSDDKIMENFNFGNEIALVNKTEPEMDETIEHEDMIIGSGELSQQNFTITKSEVSYENESNSFGEVPLDYLNNMSMSSATSLDDSMKEGEVEEEEEEEEEELGDLDDFVYTSIEAQHQTDFSQEEDSEEETIATFLTAAGQQLALYAVEDSDEIFAVARYDESGAPPENFQFLVKADVEKLIGEGAVRTVKKPSQLKRQLYSIDSDAVPTKKESPIPQNMPLKINTSPGNVKKYPPVKSHNRSYQNIGNKKNSVAKPTVGSRTLTYQKFPDGSMVLVHDDGAEIERQDKPINKAKSEKVDKSTVQYILQESEEDTSDLTLDDIEQVLSKNLELESSIEDEPPSYSPLSSPGKSPNKSVPEILNNSKLVPIRHFTLKTSYEKVPEKQTNFIPRSVTPVSENSNYIELSSTSPKVSINNESVVLSRMKRSRKQQLVVVNRADSEIIIQPASSIDFEDEDDIRPTRKRGRRKKKIQDSLRKGNSTIRKSVKTTRTNLERKYGKHRSCRIEVIDIDVESDEEEGENEETEEIDGITHQKGKEKGSSDKENNDIIMVGDSEEEESEISTKKITLPFKCTHCTKSFRQQRALDTHSRMCLKASTGCRRIADRTTSTRSTRSSSSSDQSFASSNNNKKQYACKVCGEKFDVVVALARHARLVHSLKKKRISSSSQYDEMPVTPLVSVKSREVRVELRRLSDSSITKSSTNARRKLTIKENTKGKSKSSTQVRTWKSKKMKASCSVCGRWFPSAALLSAHSLQHATKKSVSDKQMRRCQICNKLLASRLIYIRHMKMHSNKKQLQKTLRSTRQSTSQITPVKKRGRPRKF